MPFIFLPRGFIHVVLIGELIWPPFIGVGGFLPVGVILLRGVVSIRAGPCLFILLFNVIVLGGARIAGGALIEALAVDALT